LIVETDRLVDPDFKKKPQNHRKLASYAITRIQRNRQHCVLSSD